MYIYVENFLSTSCSHCAVCVYWPRKGKGGGGVPRLGIVSRQKSTRQKSVS